MKIRIVEYRRAPRLPRSRSAPKVTDKKPAEVDDPLSVYDPGCAEDWQAVRFGNEWLKLRSRMFFGVESIESIAAEYPNPDVPGNSFEMRFRDGQSVSFHQVVIAESHAETTAISG